MSVQYFVRSNLPVNKVYSNPVATTGATVTVWTPATGKSIVLSDVEVVSAFKGTVRFFLSSDLTASGGETKILEFIQGGSNAVVVNLDTPIMGSANQVISASTHTGGFITIKLGGFEQD